MRERRHTNVRQFSPGNLVSIRDYRRERNPWIPGTVIEQTGPVSYKVATIAAPGATWRGHTDQVRSTNVRETPQDINCDTPSISLSARTSPTIETNMSKSVDTPKPPEPRYPGRQTKPPKRFDDFVTV
ncbi:uncharacterized protein LOC132555506 [Ylistrum balloti]|uniref:uncharacterized protein LOC132555506 n=1 Tax=Ylistrum balloti TaxID=509963 RepID=UPI002905EB97|nr:uncharacterized protein LOC132555506 [Ylistrum balloti]